MPALKESVGNALVEQAHVEFANSHVYLQAALWFEFQNFPGIASWLRNECEEERKHAMKIVDYVVKREFNIELKAVTFDTNMVKGWKSALDVWNSVVQLEETTTTLIEDLSRFARDQEDEATRTFLGWYVMEQVESEATVKSILEKVKAYGAMPGLLYHLDSELKTSAGGTVPLEPVNV
eukprot:GFYU01004570.1.p2 GENE.GFYU01004570.1~~GFYU01004570.1.p2  ORF type:complete len:179 (-),score=66.78 GFYU01004570.1:38-574(-)